MPKGTDKTNRIDMEQDIVTMETARDAGVGADGADGPGTGQQVQKELVYNELLPYKQELEDEARNLLALIKDNLAKAVLARETVPALAVWTSNLIKYIKLYGLKFSKEDHLNFVKLIFELVTIPDLEPTKLQKYSTLLILLTKKKHLLSPDDLVIPWRPLYKIGQKIFFKSSPLYHYISKKRDVDDDDKDNEKDAIVVPQFIKQFMDKFGIQIPKQPIDNTAFEYHETLEGTYETLIFCLKPYFPVSATKEVLDEMLPQCNPIYCGSQEVIQPLLLFLPYTPSVKDIDQNFKLWLDDFLTLWKTCTNACTWESDLMSLLAYTAKHNIGYIDWNPHIPFMFAKFMRSFNFPVFYKKTQITKHNNIDITTMSTWIINVIGGGSCAQKYLDNFMTVIVTYLHNANSGRWSGKLREFLKKLAIHFVSRVHREKTSYKKTWEKATPETHKLTDEDIDAFVQCILNVALQSTFSHMGVGDICATLQQLAILRPAMVALPTINKMYATLDSLTEPHKHTCALQCVIAVASPMINGFNNGFPEGPSHVIPLLISCLPGLDANDFKKTLLSLNFISVFCTFVPLIDCSGASQYWPDLTEEEHTVCEATAQIEDFVIQFIDKVTELVESSSMENTRMEHKDPDSPKNKLESASETALTSTVTCVLMQTSTNIFKMALKKYFAFISERILEINVAGVTAAFICKAFAKVNSTETLKVFIPYLCDSISNMLSDNDILKEETLDNDILFNLLLLSRIVECDGQVLITYVPTILEVLDRAFQLTCRKGWILACKTLFRILSSLCNVELEEFRSSSRDYDESLKTFLPIREWGKPGNIWKANLKWHIPSNDEIECVQRIINKYLPVELEKLEKYSNDKLDFTREEINKSLSIVESLLAAKPLLPSWKDDIVKLVDSQIPPAVFNVTNGVKGSVTLPGGKCIKTAVYDVMHLLQNKLLNSKEDDTKSFNCIVSIWELLIIDGSLKTVQFESMMKNYSFLKRVLENKFVGRPAHPRSLLGHRAMLQHHFRCQINGTLFTKHHEQIMSNLLVLATSRYSEVRIAAQRKLNTVLAKYPYSFYSIIPQLVECLKADPETEHEKLKGALYCVIGSKQTHLVAKQEWRVVSVLWPAIVHSKPSEKPSIIKLLDYIMQATISHFPTVAITEKWNDSCTEQAKALLTTEEIQNPANQLLIDEGKKYLIKNNAENKTLYLNLINVLVEGAESTKLHWRHSLMCITLLSCLSHEDVSFPPNAIRIILQSLIHENIHVRKIALRLLSLVLKQLKKKSIKIEMNPYEIANVKEIPSEKIPGYRPDNEWLQYDMNKQFTSEDWDGKPYIHCSRVGFFSWPKPFEMYAPPKDQPVCDLNNIQESDKVIYDFFSNEDNVSKFIKFYSMEEKKGKDKFSGTRFSIYKRLFSNYGNLFTDQFMGHLPKLVADKNESCQRCAAEIIAGLIKATKHWTFSKVQKLKTDLLPIIRTALDNMTNETFNDWGTCFATATVHLDLSRVNWLIQELEKPDTGVGSAKECGRLYCLQSAIAQHTWRGGLNCYRLLNYMKEEKMLWQPYQNIRERVSSFLVYIFELDFMLPNSNPPPCPRVADFLKEIEPKLETLSVEYVKAISHSPTNGMNHNTEKMPLNASQYSPQCLMNKIKTFIKNSNYSSEEKSSMIKDLISEVKKLNFLGETEEKLLESVDLSELDSDILSDKELSPVNLSYSDLENEFLIMKTCSETKELRGCETESQINLRLFKTITRWATFAISRSAVTMRPSYYTLLPTACIMSSKDDDEELGILCQTYLGAVSQALHNEECLDTALDVVEKVCQSPSWSARSCGLGFLQTLVFQNMPLVYACDKESKVKKIVLLLMNDSRPEVREEAGQMMSGLLHCGTIQNPNELLDYFKNLCQGKRMKKSSSTPEALVKRHCGVLGLCAFVAAHPYTVPPYLPEIFLLLGRHLNDPLPIPSTIRKTLGDFKRTHHEDWENHKLKFTEEELCVLSDLSVPPSYYA